MKVRARGESDAWVGFYNHVRRRGGDVFELIPMEATVRLGDKFSSSKGERTNLKPGEKITITPEQQFAPKWMEQVDETTPETKPEHFNKVGKGRPRAEVGASTDREVL